jgi:glycosyltransferase involved in cell wall biosynthesis
MAKRVALLTNFLPHYRIPLLTALRQLVGDLRVLLSSRMERNRDWPVSWSSLQVVVQRSITWTRHFRNIHGYRDSSQIHIPWDTFFQLRSYRPDVIVSSEFGLRTLMSVLYRIAHREATLIVWATLSSHTEATHGRLRTALRRWIARRIDGAFVNGQSGQQYLAQIGYLGPVFTIPYVVDNEAFSGPSTVPSDGTLRLLYAGQLIERKGLHLFLPILARWCAAHPDRQISLCLAGDGPQRPVLASIPLPANLQLHFLGSVTPDQLPAHYHASSIFVFPTLGDEWGTVVNEALCAGLPVLGSSLSQAVEELIRESVNGWIFTPTDPDSVYAALNRALATGPATLHTMAAAARQSIASVTPAIVAGNMASAIHALSGRQRVPHRAAASL